MYFETTKQGNLVGAADIVDRHDVRVVEVGDGAGFGQIGFGVFGASHQLGVRHLDGDEPLQLVVVGEVDEAEAALAQDFLDAVATDVLRLRGGNTIDGGLVVAARLVITSSFRVVHSAVRYCVSLFS